MTLKTFKSSCWKKVPEFSLPNLFGQEELTNLDLNSENPILLNVWSSWCIPCRAEHDILMVLSELMKWKYLV